MQLVFCAPLVPYARKGLSDFRTFYAAGHMLRTGEPLYDYAAETAAQSALVSPNPLALPFMSPPYTALLFVPFSWFGFQTSYFLFLAFNLACFGLALFLLRPFIDRLNTKWRPAAALIGMSFLPLGIAMSFGQLSLLLLLLYCACFAALQSRRPILAGVFLSLALVKFQIALPVALLFLLWRQWRFFAGFLIGAVALTLLSLRITGVAATRAYLYSLLTMSQASSTGAGQTKYAMFSAQMPNLYGLLHTVFFGAPWSLYLVILLSLLVLLWTTLQRPSLPLALLASLLVSYHLYLYDLTLLLLPMLLIFNTDIDLPLKGRRKAAFFTCLLLAAATIEGTFVFSDFDYDFLFALPLAALFLLSSDLLPGIPANTQTQAA
jgi:hypothetical protein